MTFDIEFVFISSLPNLYLIIEQIHRFRNTYNVDTTQEVPWKPITHNRFSVLFLERNKI